MLDVLCTRICFVVIGLRPGFGWGFVPHCVRQDTDVEQSPMITLQAPPLAGLLHSNNVATLNTPEN